MVGDYNGGIAGWNALFCNFWLVGWLRERVVTPQYHFSVTEHDNLIFDHFGSCFCLLESARGSIEFTWHWRINTAGLLDCYLVLTFPDLLYFDQDWAFKRI